MFQVGIELNRIDLVTEVEGLDFDRAYARQVGTSYGGVAIGLLCLDDLMVTINGPSAGFGTSSMSRC